MAEGEQGGSKSNVDVPGYEILREIGRGGFAVVYLARQPALNRTVAVKVLTHIDPNDAESLRRFEAECQAIGSLSWHPHVVTVYDVGRTADGRPFMAMENLPSGSLQSKLQAHGSAPWTEAVRVGIQISDALAAAHEEGILHRDVKPANVLTDRLGEYRLADFGIARFGEVSRTATGVITGTIAYTAPDVLAGARHSVQADLYSLGATLHCLITGRTPFVGDQDESLVTIMFRATTEQAPDLLPYGVPPLFAALIEGLMAKDPSQRPRSAIEVGQWFQKIQQENGLAVTPLRSAPDARPAAPAGAADYAGIPIPPPAPERSPAPSGPSSAGQPSTPPPVQVGPSTPPPSMMPPAAPVAAAGPRPGGTAVAPATPQPAPTTPTPRPTTASVGYSTPPPADAPAFGPSYDATTRPGALGSHSGHAGGGGPDKKVLAAVAAGVLVVVLLIVGVVLSAGGGDGEDAVEAGEETTTTASASPSTEAAGPDDYSAEVEQDWIDLCVGGGKLRTFCRCAYDDMSASIPFDQYQTEVERFGADFDQYPLKFKKIFNDCEPPRGR